MEKWKYHKKQPAVQTIIKYTSLRLLTHMMRVAVVISWLVWIAFSMKELVRLTVGKELVEGIQITATMAINAILTLMLVLVVLLTLTIVIFYSLGRKVVFGVLLAVIFPLSLVSFFVSVAGERWGMMLLWIELYFVYLGFIWLGKRYRSWIHQQTDKDSHTTLFYVTCSLDELLAREKTLFSVSENWETYTSEEISEMKVSKKSFLVGSTLPKELQQQEAHRNIEWTKSYHYTGMFFGLQITRSIKVLSKVDYLRFVGECLQSGRNIFHVGEHIVGVVLSESFTNRGVLSTEGSTNQDENIGRDKVSVDVLSTGGESNQEVSKQ